MKKLVLFLLLFVGFANAYMVDSAVLDVNEMKYEPYPAEAGKYLNLWIKVENAGMKSASDVTCVLVPEYPFYLDPNENATRHVGALSPSEYALLQYKIRVSKDAVEDWNEIKIKCQTEKSNTWVVYKLKIYVKSRLPEFAIGSIVSDPEKLVPDSKDNKLTVEIQNVGNGDAELVTTRLEVPNGISPTYSYSDISNIGTLKSGESKESTFYIDIEKNVKPGNYLANLTISYKVEDESTYKTKVLPLVISVKPIPLFTVDKIETHPSKISQGDKVALKIRLRNVGFEKAKDVSVSVLKKSDQPFEFDEKYDYIGDLDFNQSGDAVFKFTVDDDANLKTYLLDLRVRYLVDDEVKTTDEQIPIKVEMEKRDSKTLFLGVIFVLAVIGVYYGWRKIRK